MYLRAMQVERYRPFARRQEIEIRPLTIIIGKNSSGKSALVRLPLLLQKALSGTAQAPLDLDIEGVDLGRSFVDLIHGRSSIRPLRIGATLGKEGSARDAEVAFVADILHLEERRLQLVHSFRVEIGGRIIDCRYDGPAAPPARGALKYSVQTTYEDAPVRTEEMGLRFDGLWPTIVEPDGLERPLAGDERFTKRLREALRYVRYLGPFRSMPQRSYPIPSGSSTEVGLHGRQAPSVLGADHLRFDRQILKRVSAFYREHLGEWALDVVPNGDTFALVVRPPGGEPYEINLVDAGAGLAQALPIIVQRIADETTTPHPWLEIVEQPELHLHPAAHGAIADLYIGAIAAPGTMVLVETHSENFVLRVQRRIAEGRLDRGQVALYFVDVDGSSSHVRRIEIGSDGEADYWPDGIFAEDFEEVRAMRRAQGERAGGR